MQLLVFSLLLGASLGAPMKKDLVKEHKSEVLHHVVHGLNPLQIGTFYSDTSANHVIESDGTPVKTVGLVGTSALLGANALAGTPAVVGTNTLVGTPVSGAQVYGNAAVLGTPTLTGNAALVGAPALVGSSAVVGAPSVTAFHSQPAVVAGGLSNIAGGWAGHAVSNVAPVWKSDANVLVRGAVATPAIAAVATPAVAAVPAVASVATVPAAVNYESQQVVQLSPKEVDVQVQHQTVHVPIEKKVHYGVQNIVTGSTTTVHKPKISAAAIAAPAVFKEKVVHNAPEVSVSHSEVTVHKKNTNYVDTPYDAGVVEHKVAPKFKNTDVHVPVRVDVPYKVANPVPVRVEQPIKIKNSVTPVHVHDVHTVKTENVVTPIEYAQVHNVVGTPAVAVQQAAAVAPAAAVGEVVHTGHVIRGPVNTGHLVGGAVNTGHLVGGAVQTGHVGAVHTGHLVGGAVQTGHVGAVNTGHLVGGAVHTGHLVGGAVQTGHLVRGAVQTGHVIGAPVVGQAVASNVALKTGGHNVAVGGIHGHHVLAGPHLGLGHLTSVPSALKLVENGEKAALEHKEN